MLIDSIHMLCFEDNKSSYEDTLTTSIDAPAVIVLLYNGLKGQQKPL